MMSQRGAARISTCPAAALAAWHSRPWATTKGLQCRNASRQAGRPSSLRCSGREVGLVSHANAAPTCMCMLPVLAAAIAQPPTWSPPPPSQDNVAAPSQPSTQLPSALLLAYHASSASSLLAAQCLVESVIELYLTGQSFSSTQVWGGRQSAARVQRWGKAEGSVKPYRNGRRWCGPLLRGRVCGDRTMEGIRHRCAS